MADFKKYIEQERDRLSKTLDDLEAKKADIDQQIDKVNQELSAIEAYEMAKEGKAPVQKKTRTRRTGMKEMMMKIIRASPQGLTRAEVLEKTGVKGDKSAEQSISNSLAQAKKKGEIMQDDNGKYKEAK